MNPQIFWHLLVFVVPSSNPMTWRLVGWVKIAQKKPEGPSQGQCFGTTRTFFRLMISSRLSRAGDIKSDVVALGVYGLGLRTMCDKVENRKESLSAAQKQNQQELVLAFRCSDMKPGHWE